MISKYAFAAFALGIVFLIGMWMPAQAQRKAYLGVGLGTGAYFGDLSDNWRSTDQLPAATIQGGYYFGKGISGRVALTYGQLGATDAAALAQDRQRRNLSFRSPIYEAQLSAMWEMIPDRRFRQRWHRHTHVSPYLHAGIAGFAFNPQAYYQGEWVDLQPLGTEGQYLRDSEVPPYSLTQIAIPAGVGVSVRFPSRFALWFELGYRKTFTDYLDDVSTDYASPTEMVEQMGPTAAALADRSNQGFEIGTKRGNPGAKDNYLFATLSLGYFFGR